MAQNGEKGKALIEFAWLWLFVLLPAPWVIRWVLPKGESPVKETALRVPFFDAIVDIQPGHSMEKPRFSFHLMFWLGMAVWVLLLLAASRPQWVGDPIDLPVSGRDLMLAVDISGSMEIPDFSLNGEAVNRLQVVKEVASQFIEARTGDRVGLILFGSQAYLQTPLTFDRSTVQSMLNDSEIGLAGKETAIGDAIGLAIKRFENQLKDNRVLILLTDGANTAGAVKPLDAAKLAEKRGIRIYAIGVGADAVEMPTLFGSRVVNPSKDLDEGTLKEMADQTGGMYFRAKNTEGLKEIYDQIDQFEPIVKDQESFRPITELYMWPLGFAVLLSVGIAVWHMDLKWNPVRTSPRASLQRNTVVKST